AGRRGPQPARDRGPRLRGRGPCALAVRGMVGPRTAGLPGRHRGPAARRQLLTAVATALLTAAGTALPGPPGFTSSRACPARGRYSRPAAEASRPAAEPRGRAAAEGAKALVDPAAQWARLARRS